MELKFSKLELAFLLCSGYLTYACFTAWITQKRRPVPPETAPPPAPPFQNAKQHPSETIALLPGFTERRRSRLSTQMYAFDDVSTSTTAMTRAASVSPIHHPPSQRQTHAASAQLQSPLMRLPTELRLIIWEFVFAPGSESVVLLSICGRLTGVMHHEDSRPIQRAAENCHALLPYRRTRTLMELRSGSLQKAWDLPLTCKQIYSESIEMWYRTNVFSLQLTQTLHMMLTRMPAQRLADIRRLRFDATFKCPMQLARTPDRTHQNGNRLWPDDGHEWQRVCDMLASRMNLAELEITLALFTRRWWLPMNTEEHKESALTLLRPLQKIKVPHFRVLMLHCDARGVQEALGESPFQLTVLPTHESPGQHCRCCD